MTSYRRITEKIVGKLNPREAYLFYCLALNSDCNTLVSHIKQENLAKFYGIQKIDQIREWLYKFKEEGLIQIDKTDINGQYGKFNKCSYRLNSEHYVLITNKLYNEDISKELKGFLILLKCKCLNGTNTCKYSQAILAKELGISESTVSRRIQEGIQNKFITKDKNGIHIIRDDIFIITNETTLAITKRIYPEVITDEDLARGYIV